MRQKTTKHPPGKPRKRRFHGLHNHPFVVPVITFLVLFFVLMVGYVSFNGQTIGASDSRVVTISIDGDEQVVPTRAENVSDLLNRLDIKLGENDIVDPSLDRVIEENNFRVNIYRARPVLVEDGAKKTVIFTAQPAPDAIAAAAGVQLFPEDRLKSAGVTTDDARDLLQDGIVAEKVVVERAKVVRVNFYCSPVDLRTQAKTVADLLAEKDIKLIEGDSLEPDPNTIISPTTQVNIARTGGQIVCDDQVIPAGLEVREDPNLLSGSEKVIQAGSNGRRLVTYEVELSNGVEVGRRVLQEVIAAEPVTRIVVKGTKVIYSNPSANVELGKQIAADLGWSKEFNCIYTIFDRESKWNHLARNRSSGAYGIPQALPGSKMGAGWETEPAVQIRWGINYMVNRYGSPCKANSFWQINHWY